MTTYTDEISIYNTDAIEDAIEGARDYYITEVTGDGIWVTPHDARPSNGQATSTTRGWHIADALEYFRGTVRYIKAWLNGTVPTIRLGQDTAGHADVTPEGLEVFSGADNLAKFASDGVRVGSYETSRVLLDEHGMHVVSADGVPMIDTTISDTPMTTNRTLDGAWNGIVEVNRGGTKSVSLSTVFSQYNVVAVTLHFGILQTSSTTQRNIAYGVRGDANLTKSPVDGLSIEWVASTKLLTFSVNASFLSQVALHIYGVDVIVSDTNYPPITVIGYSTETAGPYSIAVGQNCNATGTSSQAFGRNTKASGDHSHAEGMNAHATGDYSHAEGYGPSLGGYEVLASGEASHAEGSYTKASGDYSHAQNSGTSASGNFSHAEGYLSYAGGIGAHAEGYWCSASGDYSHVQNYRTKASSDYQTAMGKFNVEDTSDIYALIVGNGTADNARSNALAVKWDGTVERAGDVPWTNLPLSSGWKAYSAAWTPKYRRVGQVVEVRGAVSPTATTTIGNSDLTFGTLPQGCRPEVTVVQLCQSSSVKIWACSITSSGDVRTGRLRTMNSTSYQSAGTDEWLVFHITFLL